MPHTPSKHRERNAYRSRLVVRALSHRSTNGWLSLENRMFRCAIGRSGRGIFKCEGDGKTPIGRWPVRKILYRADKIPPPRTGLDLFPIGVNDGWCDDPADRHYNRPIPLPYKARAENLWRDDSLYDIVVVLGYNDSPPVAGRGSAIFMHLAKPGYLPTEGCIALNRRDLLQVVARLHKTSIIEIAS